MTSFVFFNDTVMPPETFEGLPEIAPHPIEVFKRARGTLCRTRIARHTGGTPEWHAVLWHNVNGREQALAARVHVRKYQPED